MNPQQRMFLDALEHCGIKKGITKEELMNKMKNCIPKYYKDYKEELESGNKNIHSETLPALPAD